jgi:hypothetical protein
MEEVIDSVLNTGWFGVRCIFEVNPQEADASELRTYEERLTLWQAEGFDAAIELAEADAREYAASIDAAYLGLAQCSKADVPAQGAEVYSLMRESNLDPTSYVDRYFDTGAERQHPAS